MPRGWEEAVERLRRSGLHDVTLHAVTASEDRLAAWRSWLSDEERQRVQTFGAASRRAEFVAGRAAARCLLSSVLGVAPSDVPLTVADDGAVDVDASDWLLSITHCGSHAVAGIATEAVGLDLEAIAERDPGLERFLMHPDDRGLLAALPYAYSASLVLVWTLKEAVLKARRSGFRTSPKKLRLSVRPAEGDEPRIGLEQENAHPASGQAQISVENGNDWIVTYTSVPCEEATYWFAVAVPE